MNPSARVATLTVRGPEGDPPADVEAIRQLGSAWWPLRAFRELDDALCHLRVNEPEIGVVLIKTSGDAEAVLAVDRTLQAEGGDGFVREVRLQIARTLRRLDLTAKSLFALIEPGSCFAGTLFELALAADRSYMLDDPDRPVTITVGALSGGSYPMTHGPSRLEARFLGQPGHAAQVVEQAACYEPQEAFEAGLVTIVADDIDYEDEVRLAVEERVEPLAGRADRDGGQPAFRRRRELRQQDLRPTFRLAELDLPASERGRCARCVDALRQARTSPNSTTGELDAAAREDSQQRRPVPTTGACSGPSRSGSRTI